MAKRDKKGTGGDKKGTSGQKGDKKGTEGDRGGQKGDKVDKGVQCLPGFWYGWLHKWTRGGQGCDRHLYCGQSHTWWCHEICKSVLTSDLSMVTWTEYLSTPLFNDGAVKCSRSTLVLAIAHIERTKPSKA